jgi:hypothetical protein
MNHKRLKRLPLKHFPNRIGIHGMTSCFVDGRSV